MKNVIAAILASSALLLTTAPSIAAERSCGSRGKAGDTCTSTAAIPLDNLVVQYFYIWVGGAWVLDHTIACNNNGGNCQRLDPIPPPPPAAL